MGQFGIGQTVRRVEDRRFLTGSGQYVGDIDLPRQLHAYFLRSPHPHARIRKIDATAASAAPGVALVALGRDLVADGIGTLPCDIQLDNRDGTPMKKPPRQALATDSVRYVGDGVAMVLAESLAQARDAAELIEVDYEALPAVTNTRAALDSDAPQVWPEIPGNLALDWQLGDEAAVDAALARAAHVTRLTLVNNRVVVNSMEPRGVVAAYDPGSERFTVWSSTQGSHSLRDWLAKSILHVPPERVRVITPDVGGGFGMKFFLYPEHVAVTWAARKIGRPVKWVGERSDAFQTDTHGRDHVSNAALALDADGQFLALKVETVANLGAYLSSYAPYIPTVAGNYMLGGLYRTSAIHSRVKCVYSHTVPVDAYRGAGRPEAAYLVERVVDAAARELGLSPDELRRRNFIPAEAMPFTTAAGATYDSGEFTALMEKAMHLADWSGADARKADSQARGKRRGIGMATYVEGCGGGGEDMAEVRLDPAGNVAIAVGTQSNGQGHATAYAQIAAERLGIPIERIRVHQGDTDRLSFGTGTGGSRSLPVGGHAVLAAADKVVVKARRIAAQLLEAADADIEFAEGRFTIVGTDKSVSIEEVATAAYQAERRPDGAADFGLAETAAYLPKGSTFPNGCHIVELEVDPDTGSVEIDRYTIVDDFGAAINPLLLLGQIHGGTAQGIGQALFEHTIYDPETGQLVTGSLMDYQLPRALDLPEFKIEFHNVPCKTNPLGIKGAGEAGAIGAPPAVINALVDALAEWGVSHIDMPATPQHIWGAINGQRP
ncbi:MAG: aerobic carbon-monoxide dehydrogenase large subunit [Rhodospirillaceae bacterium]|jgi:carbon-monoxide dehydrogenase large subunit|nr:aerobic carbon-monoxide dehydrogenase large subunit [Rhodospirillaceae bacterium]